MTYQHLVGIVEDLQHLERSSGVSDAELGILHRAADIALPDDYVAFLRYTDGVEGTIGPNYIAFWPAAEIAANPYPYGEFIPGLLFFGSDGGEALFGFDLRRSPYSVVVTHSDDLSLDTLVEIAPSFLAFVTLLREQDWIAIWSAKYGVTRGK